MYGRCRLQPLGEEPPQTTATAEIVLVMKVEAHRDAAEVLKPSEQSLDLPAAAIAPELPTVLRRRLLPVRLVRRDQFDALLGGPCQKRSTTIYETASK